MKQNPRKQKEPVWPKLFLGIITVLQLGLSITLHVLNRKETLKVLQNEDEMQVIATQKRRHKKIG